MCTRIVSAQNMTLITSMVHSNLENKHTFQSSWCWKLCLLHLWGPYQLLLVCWPGMKWWCLHECKYWLLLHVLPIVNAKTTQKTVLLHLTWKYTAAGNGENYITFPRITVQSTTDTPWLIKQTGFTRSPYPSIKQYWAMRQTGQGRGYWGPT
jgi:hypothetical protein